MENEELEIEDETSENDTSELDEMKAKLEKAEADAKKWKDRFKSTVAKKGNDSKTPANDINIDEIVDRKVAERDFYSKNESANQYRKEIQDLQSKYNLDVDRAYKLFMAETNPKSLIRETSTGVDWFTATVEWQKSPKEMSDKEFEETFMTKR